MCTVYVLTFVFVQASEECNIMSRKLREKPNSIEELTEMREWMKQIPEQLKSYKVQIEGMNQISLLFVIRVLFLLNFFSICP